MCRNEFLNYLRIREWQDIYSQLRTVAKTMGIHLNETDAAEQHVPAGCVDADRNRIHKTESFRVLRKYGSEIAVECHVVANEDSIAYRHRKTH